MKRLSLLAAILAVLFGAGASTPAPDAAIYQAAVFDGKLWLLEGAVVAIDLKTGARTIVPAADPIALLRADGRLWLLQHREGRARRYRISQWQDGAFRRVADLTARTDETAVALAVLQGDPVVIGHYSAAIYSPATSRWRSILFHGPRGFFIGETVAAATADGNALYIGFNRGEWGGGMVRIDLRAPPGQESLDLCHQPGEAPLQAPMPVPADKVAIAKPEACGPVTGIVADPVKPGCVIASMGLVHFSSWGDVVRICSSGQTTRLLRRPLKNATDPFESEAFFGISPAPDGFWTVSDQGLYFVGWDGAAKTYPMPKLKVFGGAWMTRDLPGVLVVSTMKNAALSLSGATPLLVPLD